MRKSGILMAISSLPSEYGIGCFSKEAYEFVDYLASAGQKIWQLLPLGPTSYGDSPYQSFSTFAGNPYFIDLQEFIDEGWLSKEECTEAYEEFYEGNDGYNSLSDDEKRRYVDYEAQYRARYSLLRRAYKRSDVDNTEEYMEFCIAQKAWLNDFALFMALKDDNGGCSFVDWEPKLRFRDDKALADATKRLKTEIGFYKFLQYYFFKQWATLKAYANEKGIEIVGDIPIYVAADSADVWANPELFLLDKEGRPKGVAGCPPDYFSPTGQLWGNPLYDWDYHKETGFRWWISRMSQMFTLYDIVRIDHFRAFDEYYFIPFGDLTAEFGHWEPGPGYDLFAAFKKELGKVNVIAEDLGFLTPTVLKLVKKTGYPGMKVLEFAFDSEEDNDYLPHNYDKNCVVYTGTHDNDTVKGWYPTLSRADKKFCKDYIGVTSARSLNKALIRTALASVADTAIVPMQDVLNLGSECRMNTPSTLGFNWKWRMLPGELKKKDAEWLSNLVKTYGR